ncbi:MAG TPA: hypothetical protein VKZ76_04320 [Edaphocola sp.]|nr:hypothetical protein [Edaphocola sp.]
MKIRHSILALPCLLAVPFAAKAQNFEDALRFSMLSTGSTARSVGIGGAAGSLGADFSAASVNPAGMAIYRQSELTFTPYLRINNASSDYIDQTDVKESNTALKLGNLGMVFNNNLGKKSGWKNYTVAVGFNKLADFNTKTIYQGLNRESSFTELMAYDAQNYGVNEENSPLGFLGYNGYLLTDQSDGLRSIPYNNIIRNGGALLQTKYAQAKGAVNDFNFSIAGNYDDKLMVGGAIGLTTYRFHRTTEFIEADNTGNRNNDFDYFSLTEKLQTTGVGIVGKFGMIYAVNPYFRIGASVHTPTYASLTDYVDYELISETEQFGNGKQTIVPDNIYRSDYSITSPMKAVLSATGFFGTKGFITADAEYIPYNTMRINYQGVGGASAARMQNDYIKENFRGVINGRIGVELRANSVFSVRAGGAYYANPYKEGRNDLGGDRVDLSLGFGYKLGRNAFLDLTYMNSSYAYKEVPYSFNAPGINFYSATTNMSRHMVAATIGLRF